MQVGQCVAGGAVYGPAGAAGCPAGLMPVGGRAGPLWRKFRRASSTR